MCVLELYPREGIAKCVVLIPSRVGLWRDDERVVHALLIQRRPRHQMQQLMGMHDIAVVGIDSLVPHAITDSAHVANALAAAPVCEKCRIESRSESWPAANPRSRSCSTSLRRAAAAMSPSTSSANRSASPSSGMGPAKTSTAWPPSELARLARSRPMASHWKAIARGCSASRISRSSAGARRGEATYLDRYTTRLSQVSSNHSTYFC